MYWLGHQRTKLAIVEPSQNLYCTELHSLRALHYQVSIVFVYEFAYYVVVCVALSTQPVELVLCFIFDLNGCGLAQSSSCILQRLLAL